MAEKKLKFIRFKENLFCKVNIMSGFDSPVSFTWAYPKYSDKGGDLIAYCFAYVKDNENHGVLYAGVKYQGDKGKFGVYKEYLRRTAVIRLIKKPIYCVFNPTEETINDKNNKLNGFDYFNKEKGKLTVSMSKFFLHCAFNYKYSNIGLCANKKNNDLRLEYNGERYELTNTNSKNCIYIKYGYIFDGDGHKIRKISPQNGYVFGKGYDVIINLRKKSMFFGKGKERRRLDEFENLGNEYLRQFGIGERKVKLYKDAEVKFRDYHNNPSICYYKCMLSNNKRLHMAFMNFNDWINWVSDINDYNFETNMKENSLCFAYSIEDLEGSQKDALYRKQLFKRIALDRLLYRPNIVGYTWFNTLCMKEKRIWLSSRVNVFYPQGPRKIDSELGCIKFDSEFLEFKYKRYKEHMSLYVYRDFNKMSVFQKVSSILNDLLLY